MMQCSVTCFSLVQKASLMNRSTASIKFTVFKLEAWLKQYNSDRAMKLRIYHQVRTAKTKRNIT